MRATNVMAAASVVNLADWFNRRHGVGPDDVMLQVAAFTFDLSVYDVFGVLAAGGSMTCLIPSGWVLDVDDLGDAALRPARSAREEAQ